MNETKFDVKVLYKENLKYPTNNNNMTNKITPVLQRTKLIKHKFVGANIFFACLHSFHWSFIT